MAKRLNLFLLSLSLAVFAPCFFVTSASALAIEIEYDYEFSGGTPPEGTPPPWLTATIDDQDSPGSVVLRLEATNLTDQEFVGAWLFNLDPTLDVTALTFTLQSGEAADSLNLSPNAYEGGGSGKYDIQLLWDAKDFTDGDYVEYLITGISGLTAESFLYNSFHNNEIKTLLTAAHVQAIGERDEGSGWITGGTKIIPEPSTVALLSAGLAGLFAVRGRRRKKS